MASFDAGCTLAQMKLTVAMTHNTPLSSRSVLKVAQAAEGKRSATVSGKEQPEVRTDKKLDVRG